MEIPELPYTVPRVVKGRVIKKVPAGSTMEKEAAKQSWYVEFFFHNSVRFLDTDKVIKSLGIASS
ncbi:hypothetical protein QF042_003739 [Pedobacter sp. W3I1]|uniref:hypothetical protein n=1 Tax=Pedobacter sp. W3I1 TaxID=3042291 RepID=UPI002787E52C|nr:hypothetical protein [Pedobacter sp. W3I1]MDQ0640174.1 hypothetical protein [Pedobacter sp. W3I1]